MAGSYEHCIDNDFNLLKPRDLEGMIENLGDAYEAIEEMVSMINYLSGGDMVKLWKAHESFCETTYPHYKGTPYVEWVNRIKNR